MIKFTNILYQEDLKFTSSYFDENLISGKTFLITGATGLIGSFIADTLVYYNRNHAVKCDIYCMGRSLVRLNERFGYCNSNDNLNFLEHDISKPLDFSVNFDYIIHAASNADPVTFALYPVETITSNVSGTINLFEYMRKSINSKMVFVSTREVYGLVNDAFAYKEADYGLVDFNSLRACYPESKRTAELLCKGYVEQYNMSCSITRLGYVYGSSMRSDDSRAVTQFMQKALLGHDIVLKSPGLQKRSYSYVADAVTGILTVLFRGKNGETYNVSDINSVISIKDMAEMISELAETRVVSGESNELEKQGSSSPQDSILDDSKLKQLGWSAKYNIKLGIRRMFNILSEQ